MVLYLCPYTGVWDARLADFSRKGMITYKKAELILKFAKYKNRG